MEKVSWAWYTKPRPGAMRCCFVGKKFVVCLSTTKTINILFLPKYPLYGIEKHYITKHTVFEVGHDSLALLMWFLRMSDHFRDSEERSNPLNFQQHDLADGDDRCWQPVHEEPLGNIAYGYAIRLY